jgi:hypothetical protein
MAGMSEKQLEKLVNSISYKKGFKLKRDGRLLRWEVTAEDNYGRYDSVEVQFQWFEIPAGADVAIALRLIFVFLAYAEDHEMRERFKVRGRSVYNPHRYGQELKIEHGKLDGYAAKVTITASGDDLR